MPNASAGLIAMLIGFPVYLLYVNNFGKYAAFLTSKSSS